jgi:predicted DNA-binding ribbon-helix-helix protein
MKSKRAKSPVVKRAITIAGHKTSVSIEDEFWEALKEIANERGMSRQALIASIDAERRNANLSSAIRVFVIEHYWTTKSSPEQRNI